MSSEEESAEISASTGKTAKHSHIHISKGDQAEEEDIDIVEEFHKRSDYEQAEIMLMIRPITFFKCIKNYFDDSCQSFIESSLESVVAPQEQQIAYAG